MTATRAATLDLSTLIEEVARQTARSLEVIREIETTVENLTYTSQVFAALAGFARALAKRFKDLPPRDKVFDPEGEDEQTLLSTQKILRELYGEMVRRRSVAQEEPAIDEEDGVVEEYSNAIEAAADLHEAINTLRWSILERDADLDEPAFEVVDSVDELFKKLKSTS